MGTKWPVLIYSDQEVLQSIFNKGIEKITRVLRWAEGRLGKCDYVVDYRPCRKNMIFLADGFKSHANLPIHAVDMDLVSRMQ